MRFHFIILHWCSRAGFPVGGMVGVESPGDGPPRDLQCHPLGFGLGLLEVVNYADADQARGFGSDLAADFRLDRPNEIL